MHFMHEKKNIFKKQNIFYNFIVCQWNWIIELGVPADMKNYTCDIDKMQIITLFMNSLGGFFFFLLADQA